MRKISAALTVGVLAFGLAACGETNQDAKVDSRDTGPARTIINMPDGFSNVAAKCDGPNMVYVIFHGNAETGGARAYGSLAVVGNDPRCTKTPQ